jgi:hypothetical protein
VWSSQSKAAVQNSIGAIPSQCPSAPSARVKRRNCLGQVRWSKSSLPWPVDTGSDSLSVTRIVQLFARNPGRLITQDQLLWEIWGLRDQTANYVRVFYGDDSAQA